MERIEEHPGFHAVRCPFVDDHVRAVFARYEPTDDVAIMTIAFAQHPSDETADGKPLWSVGVRGVRAPLASHGPTPVDGRVTR
jgi:hypothetical protein